MKVFRDEHAKCLEGTIRVMSIESLPNGVDVITVPCNDYRAVRGLPGALEFRAVTYGFSGWNSDRHVAYYRTDAVFARQG